MAEFREVVREYKRMCEALSVKTCSTSNGVVTVGCSRDCPLHGQRTERVLLSCDHMLAYEPEQVERAVMEWAKKHPEPAYPTFRDWACGIIAEYKIDPNLPLPADVAEKLGIKLEKV